MRLFQVIAGGEHGGFETFCTSLSTELAALNDFEQAIATRPWPARLEKFENAGIEIHPMKLGGTMDFASSLKLKRAIKSFQPDIILTWANRATSKTPRGQAPICGRIGHYYSLKYYAHTDFLITITERLRDYVIAGGYPAERVATIPNFHRTTGAAPVNRDTLNTPESVPLVVAVGRLHRAKGFDVLLNSLAELDDTHLWLAGTGPEEDALKKLAGDLGLNERVKFLGWRNDAEALMRAADVVAMPSRSEGLGTVIFEAWASGTPLVAAASEGPAEFVVDGKNGRLVPIDDETALTQALKDVVQDKSQADQLATAAHKEYQENYTAEKITARYRDVLENFAAKGARTERSNLKLKSTDTAATELRAKMGPK